MAQKVKLFRHEFSPNGGRKGVSWDGDGILHISVSGAAEVAQIETITTVADVADSLDATFFQLSDDVGTVGVWIDTDDSGTAAPGGASALDRQIEVTGVVTGDTAEDVATAVASAINADSKFSASAVGDVVTVTHATAGDVADGEDGDTGFSFAVTTNGRDSATTKLVYSHDGATWHDHDAADSSVTGNGQFAAISMAADREKYWLSIEADGAAVVVYGEAQS